MRDATKVIASKIVGAAKCCDSAMSDSEKGAARVLVTGKRGVGKVSVSVISVDKLVLNYALTQLQMLCLFSNLRQLHLLA